MRTPHKKILFKNNSTYSISSQKGINNSIPWHVHSEPEILYIHNLKGTLLIGNRVESIHDDHLYFIAPNIPHSYQIENKVSSSHLYNLVTIHLNIPKVKHITEYFPEFQSLKKTIGTNHYSFKLDRNELKKAHRHIKNIDTKYQLDQILSVFRILEIITNSNSNKILSAPPQANQGDEEDDRMNKILKFTHANFSNPIEINDVAEMVHLTRESFCRYFKQKADQTYISFLLELRINHACQKLQFTNFTIREIAYKSGFSNIPHFNRHFKKIMKMTPTQYRACYK